MLTYKTFKHQKKSSQSKMKDIREFVLLLIIWNILKCPNEQIVKRNQTKNRPFHEVF